jgi:hypothetical protein
MTGGWRVLSDEQVNGLCDEQVSGLCNKQVNGLCDEQVNGCAVIIWIIKSTIL